jgi:hypothetical protein
VAQSGRAGLRAAQLKVLGRIDRHDVAADRPTEDHAQRVQDVLDRRRRQPIRGQRICEALDVGAGDLREPLAPEYGHDPLA